MPPRPAFVDGEHLGVGDDDRHDGSVGEQHVDAIAGGEATADRLATDRSGCSSPAALRSPRALAPRREGSPRSPRWWRPRSRRAVHARGARRRSCSARSRSARIAVDAEVARPDRPRRRGSRGWPRRPRCLPRRHASAATVSVMPDQAGDDHHDDAPPTRPRRAVMPECPRLRLDPADPRSRLSPLPRSRDVRFRPVRRSLHDSVNSVKWDDQAGLLANCDAVVRTLRAMLAQPLGRAPGVPARPHRRARRRAAPGARRVPAQDGAGRAGPVSPLPRRAGAALPPRRAARVAGRATRPAARSRSVAARTHATDAIGTNESTESRERTRT